MFSLFGAEKNLKNICLLSAPYIDLKTVTTSNDLKPGFQKFLANHQPETAPAVMQNELFKKSAEMNQILKSGFRLSSLNDFDQNDLLGEAITGDELENLVENTQLGLELLQNSHKDLKHVFELAVHNIFFCRSKIAAGGQRSFGGSSSTAIGTIWISGLKNLRPCDTAEFILHEMTHNLLFIAERCEAQFYYSAMIKPENFAQSAILRRKRPMDKVVHSIIVATEILLARHTFLETPGLMVHPENEKLLAQTLTSIDDVFSLPNLSEIITDWTRELLLRARATLVKEYKVVA